MNNAQSFKKLLFNECRDYVNESQDNLKIVLLIASYFECLNFRHQATASHSMMVAEYCYLMGRKHDLNQAFLYYLGGLSHDIGKLTFPDYILEGKKLIKDRRKIMRHVKLGVQFLSKYSLPSVVMNIVKFHHERFDGEGYLEGLAGKNIPLEARIAAIADVYCAMQDPNRKYQNSKKHDEAIEIMQESKFLFDEDLLDSFCEVSKNYNASVEVKEGISVHEDTYYSGILTPSLFGGYECYGISKRNCLSYG